MKPTTTFSTQHRPARDYRRAHKRHIFPAPDCFFQPQSDSPLGRDQRRSSAWECRAFRRMTLEMLAKHERDESLEIALFAFVTAIAAWSLATLLIVLAQTGNG